MDAKKVALRFEECELNELLFITPEYITPYLTFIKENQRLFKTSLNQLGSMNFDDVYNRMFKHIFTPILSKFHVPENEHPYMMKFYLSGVTAVVMEWIDNGCMDDMNSIVNILTECIMGERNINGQNT